MDNCYQRTNGRINITGPNISNLFDMYDKNPVHTPVTYKDAFLPQMETNDLNKEFFSQTNIDILQTQIIAGVYQISNNKYKISKQSQDTLIMIMREVYEQGAQNSLENMSINDQTISLNKIVLNYSIPQIFKSVQSYYKYIKDASTLPSPIDRPNAPDFVNKTLEPKPFF